MPPWRWALVGAMALATVAAVAVPPIAAFFDLTYPPSAVWWVIAVVLVVAQIAIRFVPVATDGDDES